MAVRAKTIDLMDNVDAGGKCRVVVWTGLTKATDDTGDPMSVPGFSDRSVQVEGTFGAGGSCRIEGSNNGVNYRVLTDPQGNALDITAAKIEAVVEATKY